MEKYCLKIAFLGDSGVGKTSIITCITRRKTVRDTMYTTSTIGGAFFGIRRKISDESDDSVYLNIWDTAGQERYRSLIPMFTRGAQVIILVYDVSDINSWLNLERWVRTIENKEFPFVVVIGNKTDLEEVVDEEEVELQINRWKTRGINIYINTRLNCCDDESIDTTSKLLGEIITKYDEIAVEILKNKYRGLSLEVDSEKTSKCCG